MLYLQLLHGRRARDEVLSDWGFPGPLVGPLVWIQATYSLSMTILGSDSKQAAAIDLIDGMIFHDGHYYGEWVFLADDLIARDEAGAAVVFEQERFDPDRGFACKGCQRCSPKGAR